MHYKGVVNSVDEKNRITVTTNDNVFLHSAGKSYDKLSDVPIYLQLGDEVEVETADEVNKANTYHVTNVYHIIKIKKWRAKEMRKTVLNTVEKIKEMRAAYVQKMESIARDTDLTTEGKRNRMNSCIKDYHNEILTITNPVIRAIENNIKSITDEENGILLKKRTSADYATTLDSTVRILADNAKNISAADVEAAVSVFANDPLAIQAIKTALKGSDKEYILPEDTRGTRQEYLEKTMSSLKSAVEMLAAITYQEDGFAGSTKVNDFYISNQALVFFDMAFVESLNDDCTGKRPEQLEKPENVDFGFNFRRLR